MTSLQQRQIAGLQQHGWLVAAEHEGRIDLVHPFPAQGAFTVMRVHPAGGYSWEGSFPLAKLPAMYPTLLAGRAA